ncbi:hypothetical protein [Psychrobacter jeotgali]|uniref:hypothetical protein n=1 Tax=Psychrobacter jeotgali TaxID=179010 RepID=UPI00191A036D|nr:hypothetical protein [Psychrobacter jeotgali]
MSADIRSNSPKKESLYALGGVALFLAIVLIVGVSAFLRPAGEHITAETTDASAAVNEEVIAEEAAAPVENSTATAEDTTDSTEVATPADATITPPVDSGDAVIAAESGTATADDTVSQAAAADTDLTAEQADGDLEGAAQ